MEILFEMVRKPLMWAIGCIAIFFLPMTIIMFLVTAESFEEFKDDVIGFHKWFFN